MRAFKPKHPLATNWYSIRWREPLVGTPIVTVEPQPASVAPVSVADVQLSSDGFAAVWRSGGGSAGEVWELEVQVQGANGGTLVEEVRLPIAE